MCLEGWARGIRTVGMLAGSKEICNGVGAGGVGGTQRAVEEGEGVEDPVADPWPGGVERNKARGE